MSSYYDILEINKLSSANEIKESYKRLAKKYHPDRNKDANSEKKFKQVSEAYAVLSDPARKEEYDRQFSHTKSKTYSTQWGSDDFSSVFTDFVNFKFFSNTKVYVTLTLEEVARGVNKSISYAKHDFCSKCLGDSYSCPNCNGSGFTTQVISQIINVPAGVENGQYLSLLGAGGKKHKNSHSIDIIVYFDIQKHKSFLRKQSHLYANIGIGVIDACLGTKFTLLTIYGEKIEISIPAGIQHGQVLKIENKGLPVLNKNKYGDLFVEVKIIVPKNLDESVKNSLREISKIQKI